MSKGPESYVADPLFLIYVYKISGMEDLFSGYTTYMLADIKENTRPQQRSVHSKIKIIDIFYKLTIKNNN